MLTRRETREFYDRFGRRQDRQSFYENPALELLIEHGSFSTARAVFEFGCGTGRFAARLLKDQLPAAARYLATDLSETMTGLARRRLEPFGERAVARLSEGSPRTGLAPASFDRFVSNYVLDILSETEIEEVFEEARRLLEADGRLCLTSLACGETFVSRKVSDLWTLVHRLRPKLVGGCRPLEPGRFVDGRFWETLLRRKVSAFGITSEVLVLRKLK